ncbi:substrate-binding domain-containing protein [Streptomyces sp. NPDC088124]|uniref:substrate-binding domain-containing protein n=1 Tax=Streptomyces sp. NPDC088124 TaxID=3154654 RepID=UPI0034445ECF
MGRHSLPDARSAGARRARSPRRRTVTIAAAVVVSVAAGTGIAAGSGLLSLSETSCDNTPVRLDLVASPDIAPALRAVADRARRDHVTSDGRCIDIRVTARENAEVANTLATSSVAPDYQIWVPDSDLWVERATGAGDGVALTPAGNVALSPVALAALPTSAQALGWPAKTYTWAALAAATGNTDTVRLGAADPSRSATGLLALSSIAESERLESERQGGDPRQTGAGQGGADGKQGADGRTKTEDQEGAGGTRAAATARLLTQRVSESDSRVLESLARDDAGAGLNDPRSNEAVLLSEQAAFRHNSENGGSAKLDLFYPTDGAPALDYPYSLVNQSALSTDESRAAMRFMALLSEDSSYRTLAEHGFRVANTPVHDDVLLTAGGRSPQPYTGADARPPSAEAVERALGLWTMSVRSARLTTVVDASGSMEESVPGRGGQSRMDVTKASLLRVLAQFTAEDELGLWEFSTRLDGAKDYRKLEKTAPLGEPAKGGGTHRERLSDAFTALKPVPDGDTGLYDTALASYREARASYVPGKFNALIILTDGSNKDDDSVSRGKLVEQLKELADPERPVPLIGVAVGPDADRKELDAIARATGGAAYEVSDPADIQSVILRAIMLSASESAADATADTTAARP